MAADPTLRLAREKYISLTTTRRDGRAVSTPVWFALDGGKLYVYTGADSGKVKRIRHTPRVTVAPCTRSGKVTGEAIPATARLLPASDGPRVDALLVRKYPIGKRLYALATGALRLARRQQPGASAYLEISLG